MIRDHDFNSEWWGARVGFIESPDFFKLPEAVQLGLLAPYAWAEFRCPIETMPSPWSLKRADFVQVDTQIGFRIDLRKVPPASCDDGLTSCSADSGHWALVAGETAAFRFERFSWLHGVTPERLADRYVRWATLLASRAPEFCLEFEREGLVEGWFCSETTEHGLHLALALHSKAARSSGALLYQRGLDEYRRKGAVIGYASFSVRNTPVHRIYSHLGATFTPPTGCWLWQKESP